MALIQCPECGAEKISSEAIACPKCGFSLASISQEEKAALEEKEIQREKEKAASAQKSNIGCLALILVVLLAMLWVWSTISSSSSSSKNRAGYCDVCGRKATTYWASHEVCDSCFRGILNTEVD